MDKQQVITFIQGQLAAGSISKEDILSIANNGATGGAVSNGAVSGGTAFVQQTSASSDGGSKNLTHIFYGIGAIIAIVGVIILIAQNWQEIGFIGRILVTLGLSLGTYVFAMFLRNPEQRSLSQVMFTISAALAPIGSFVLLEEASINFSWNVQMVVSGILFVIFGTALWVSKKNILVLVAVAFASWNYYAFIIKTLGVDYYSADLLKWAIMILGFSYIFIAYGHKSMFVATDGQDEKEKRIIREILYGLGTIGVLGAGIFVGGIFDLIFILFIFGAFYGSVYLRSRNMLIFGALFLMAHIIKLTSEYFVDSIGWPVALIGVGFLVIGIGYATFYINRKFISAR